MLFDPPHTDYLVVYCVIIMILLIFHATLLTIIIAILYQSMHLLLALCELKGIELIRIFMLEFILYAQLYVVIAFIKAHWVFIRVTMVFRMLGFIDFVQAFCQAYRFQNIIKNYNK